MSKAYISLERLRLFIENIATAPTAKIEEVDYLLAVKDGKLYRITGLSAPYLYVTPEETQWISPTLVADYEVRSNRSWIVK